MSSISLDERSRLVVTTDSSTYGNGADSTPEKLAAPYQAPAASAVEKQPAAAAAPKADKAKATVERILSLDQFRGGPSKNVPTSREQFALWQASPSRFRS